MMQHQGPFGQALRSIRLPLLALSALLAPGLLSAQTTGTQAAAPAAPSQAPAAQPTPPAATPPSLPFLPRRPAFKFVDPRPETTVVGHTSQGDITIKDIKRYALTGLMTPVQRLQLDKIPALPNDALTSTAQWVASVQAAAAEIEKKNDPKLTEFVSTDLQKDEDWAIIGHIVRTEIADANTTPTEQEIKAYYDKHVPEYRVPFQFTMRHMILMTYEPYVVQAGDSLESIAQKVCGDQARSAEIRADVPSKPLRREASKEFKPLAAGEKLLVPMGPARADQIKARLEGYLKELQGLSPADQANKFQELAAKYSEAETKGEVIGPMPSGTRPVLPELIEIAKKTPEGGISPIFRTKHGFQVVQIMKKVEEHVQPLDDVRRSISDQLRQDRLEARSKQVLDKIFASPALKVDYAKFKEGDRLTTDTVIATVGETTKIQWNEVKDIWKEKGRPDDPDRIKPMLEQLRPFQVALSREYVKPQLADPQTTIAQQLKAVRIAHLGTRYISKLASEKTKELVTPEKRDAYYEAHKGDEFKEAVKVKVTSMEAVLDPSKANLKGEEREKAIEDLKKKLAGELSKVKSGDDFLATAQRVNEPLKALGVKPYDIPELTPMNQVAPPEVQDQLKKIQPGQWSEPFQVGESEVIAILLQEATPERVKSKDEVIDQLNRDVYTQIWPEQHRNYQLQFLQQADFKPAL